MASVGTRGTAQSVRQVNLSRTCSMVYDQIDYTTWAIQMNRIIAYALIRTVRTQ